METGDSPTPLLLDPPMLLRERGLGRKRQRRGTSPHLLGVAGTGKHRRILGVLRARPAPKVGVAWGRGVRWRTVRGIEGALPTAPSQV